MNEAGEESADRQLSFFEFIPVEFLVEMATGTVFFVCMFICWRVLSKNPASRRLGAGFGFICLSFLVPVALTSVDYLLGGEGESNALFWVSEIGVLLTLLVGTYYLVSGSRRMGRAEVDV